MDDAARVIAHRLVADAFWHGDRCTWLGDGIALTGSGATEVISQVIDRNLYDGLAGILLFLARAARSFDDDWLADAAMAVARQLLATPAQAVNGFYVGEGGVGFALVDAGACLAAPALSAAGETLVADSLEGPSRGPGSSPHDLLGGDAGRVRLAVTMAELSGEERWLDRAEALARGLAGAALASAGECYWPSRAALDNGGLLGLAHGNAGIALALASVLRHRPGAIGHEAVGAALAFERARFDPAQGNWPDLRRPHPSKRGQPRECMTAWCHGATGIAAGRRAIGEPLLDARAAAEAQAGLAATARYLEVRAAAGDGAANDCLCHGAAGATEVLWDALREPAPGMLDAIEPATLAHWRRLTDDWMARLADIYTGFGNGRFAPLARSPGLFLGVAGVGHLLLRHRSNGEIASVLA